MLGRTEKSQWTVSTFPVPIIKYNPFAACPFFLRSAHDFGIPVAATLVLLTLIYRLVNYRWFYVIRILPGSPMSLWSLSWITWKPINAPGGPAGRACPGKPCSPFGPINPSSLFCPGGPIGPIDPSSPFKPSLPRSPFGPAGPGGPVKPFPPTFEVISHWM